MSPTSIDGSIASTPTRLPSIEADTVATRRELGALGALGAVAGVNLEEVLRLYRDSNGAAGSGVPQLAAPKMTAAQASERIRANTAAAPFFSVDDMTVQLSYMQSLTDGLISQRQMSDIRGSQADMKQKNAQQLEKVKKWINDLDQEASARKTSGIWGWVKNVFSVVASGVAAFLAIAASPFTGGASGQPSGDGLSGAQGSRRGSPAKASGYLWQHLYRWRHSRRCVTLGWRPGIRHRVGEDGH